MRLLFSQKHRAPSTVNRLMGTLFLFLGMLLLPLASQGNTEDRSLDAPLIVGNRTLLVFHAHLGNFTAAERAESARQRIEKTLNENGEGWTSVKPTAQGIAVELDSKTMFYVLTGDFIETSAEPAEEVANQASRTLQKVWREAQERHAPEPIKLQAVGNVLIASALLIGAIALIIKGSRWLREHLGKLTRKRLQSIPKRIVGTRILTLIPLAIARLSMLAAWLLSLLLIFTYLTYCLDLFVVTRPASENLSHSINQLLLQIIHGMTDSLPGLFIATLIFMAAAGATKLSSEFFTHVETFNSSGGILNAHSAPATRRLVNTTLWLFSIAMAYPYLPGAHTEAFKGISVILGLMVSIGASGLLGQIASGVMLVYTRALLVGEYVRILDCEGTVVELGTFVTRLRTGLGEEISLPNSLVLTNITRNFSRETQDQGVILNTTITIGYDTPWRQVHALLLEAAAQIPDIQKNPAPFVVQTALSDFYVAYKLVLQINSKLPERRGRVTSELHAAIQDAFNRHGVQIMSPQYFEDPKTPKTVPETDWYLAPAQRPK